jgi:hypothetical protein
VAKDKGVALVIGIGKGKPKQSSDMMGGDEPEADDNPEEETSEVQSAANDMFDALKAGDRETFTQAFEAAVSSKCAELYGSKE